MIKDFPNSQFVGGGEESFGYMVGDFVRDKDAVTATLLACEVAAQAKYNGSSFYKELIDSYVQFGFYKEKLISLTKKGMSGAEEIKQMLKDFKENPVASVQGSKSGLGRRLQYLYSQKCTDRRGESYRSSKIQCIDLRNGRRHQNCCQTKWHRT